MDLTALGTLRQQVNTLKLKNTWQEKVRTGHVTGHPQDTFSLSQNQEKPEERERMEAIMAKVSAGKPLTPEEKSYLQAKDPITSQKLEAQEQERKSYENALKRCRTKEEVRRLKMTYTGAALASAKSIENNPNIPAERKQTLLTLENRRVQGLEASTQKFHRSGAFRQLPTQEEAHRVARAEGETLTPSPVSSRQSPEKPVEETVDPETLQKVRKARGRSGPIPLPQNEEKAVSFESRA